MATIGSGSPLLYVEGSATQTGASGTKRTIKITAKFKVNGSSSSIFGYACDWRARVHNSYGSWAKIKGTEMWNGGNGLRTFTQTLTVDVGTTSSKSITVGIYTNSSGSNSWDGNYTWKFTVGATNSAPYFGSGDYVTCRENNSSGAVITAAKDGTENAKKIGENISSIYLSWPSAGDKEGGTLTYEVGCQQNDGSWSSIGETTSRSFTHKIGTGNEGRKYDYRVRARDNKGALSGWINGTQFEKNKLTPSTLSSSTALIGKSTELISFSWSNPSNTNKSTSFDFEILCSGITVYRGTTTTDSARSMNIAVLDNVPSAGAYILRQDLIAKVAGTSYKGTLTFSLKTKNAYGTAKTQNLNINVDLQSDPTAPSTPVIASSSTTWKTSAADGREYLIPDGVSRISFDWQKVSGASNETITYDIYVDFGGMGWNFLSSTPTGINGNTYFYHHVLPKQLSSNSIQYMVKAKTNYGTYSPDAFTSVHTLHYYNPPSLTSGTVVRGSETATVPVTIKLNTSLPNVNVVGSWKIYKKGTAVAVGNSGTLSVNQGSQTLKLTGLIDEGQYDLKITYKDNTGFSVDNVATISIGANSPVFFVNKYGIGVNGVKANERDRLNIKGGLNADSVRIRGQEVYHPGNKPTAEDVGALSLGAGGNVNGNIEATSMTINGVSVLSDIQMTPLWRGYHHMMASEIITPSKPLSQCNGGWVLVWSDFNTGGTGEDWNYVYSYIPKNSFSISGANHDFLVATGEDETRLAVKALYLWDTYIKGADTNKDRWGNDVVIRAVYEY